MGDEEFVDPTLENTSEIPKKDEGLSETTEALLNDGAAEEQAEIAKRIDSTRPTTEIPKR